MKQQTLCLDGILNKKNFEYDSIAEGIYDGRMSMSLSKESSCHLHRYTSKHVVNCLDPAGFNKLPNRFVRFLFIGDSRIRQQFYNFLKVLYYFSCLLLSWLQYI